MEISIVEIGWMVIFTAMELIFLRMVKGNFILISNSLLTSDRFEGQLFQGRKQGKGKFFYLNGNTYVGDFKLDQKSGQGKMIYSNGSTYEGNWESGE
jgi:hypothetical protein